MPCEVPTMQRKPTFPRYERLSAVLSEHGLSLGVKYDYIRRESGLIIDVLRIRVTWPDGRSAVLLPMHFPDPEKHQGGAYIEERMPVIFVGNHDEAAAECAKYEPLQWLGSCFLSAWRRSMSPDDYYPVEGPGGPHLSYSHYRSAMIDSDGYRDALSLLRVFGDDLFEAFERAARLDAGLLLYLPHGPTETETRAVVVRNFAPHDPENNIDDAIMQSPSEEISRLEKHVEAGDRLCCPFCLKPHERKLLGIYSVRPEDSKRSVFVWGCNNCIREGQPGLTLDRIPSLSVALKWTDHLLSKPYFQHPKALKSWLACLRGIFGDLLRMQEP